MKKRHLLSIADLTSQEIWGLIRSGVRLKKEPAPPVLTGKSVALLFEKPSLRTRVTFDVAVHELGGHPIYLGREEIGMGVREPAKDIARVLSRYVNVLVVRTFAQSTLATLAHYASVPVINALSDDEHPCQALADLLTIYEKKGGLEGINISYIGDGNNVASSLAIAAASVGANFAIASPHGYHIPSPVMEEARRRARGSGGGVTQTESPNQVAKDADVIYTDVWVSMGQEEETERRRKSFEAYRVDEGLLARARDDALFMHPLPAHPGEEISEGLLEHLQSVVFDQAENRLHIQKAILTEILG
ncbi:ornithine carbamoyltransferase [SAR202 cluster bacterium AC-647-N09_OGT_505m]|nr:ornithine carbamoyltransferase [SAR202 cluster bacterium AC-647-N09_OGT_505m]